MKLQQHTLILIQYLQDSEERNHDLVQVYKNYFERRVNPTNLALFIDSYVRRTDLNITRELDPTRKKEGLTLSVPVMNITGALSPHVDDTVTLNGRLDPRNSSWMKVSSSVSPDIFFKPNKSIPILIIVTKSKE